MVQYASAKPIVPGNKRRLVLKLFGSIELGEEFFKFDYGCPRKSLLALAFLGMNAQVEVKREALARLLWPDSGRDRSRVSLRRCLSDLAAHLGTKAPLLVRRGYNTLMLDLTPAHVDAVEFQRLSNRHDVTSLERCFALYRGTFLDGFLHPWVQEQRERFKRQFVDVCERLAEHSRATENYKQEAEYLKRATEADVNAEAVRYARMLALHRCGENTLACAEFLEYRDRLRSEAGRSPSPEFSEMYSQIRAAAFADNSTLLSNRDDIRSTTTSMPTELWPSIGRRAEIDAVVSALASSRLVTVCGPLGIGKSRVAADACRRLMLTRFTPIHYVDLAGAADARAVQHAVARTFGLTDTGVTEIERRIEDESGVLLLDNADSVRLESAKFALRLLQVATSLNMLWTCAQPLNCGGEYVVGIPPLQVRSRVIGLQASMHDEAEVSTGAELFVSVATRAGDMSVTDPLNLPSIERVCAALDGYAAAIHAVASSTHVMPLRELEAHVRQGDAQLQEMVLTLPAMRQMRSAIDRQVARQPQHEQMLLRRMSIFDGDATEGEINGVCFASAVLADGMSVSRHQPGTMHITRSLLEKRMICARTTCSSVTYSLPPIARAVYRTSIGSDEFASIARRFAQYYSGAISLQRDTQSFANGRQPDEERNREYALVLCKTVVKNKRAERRLGASLAHDWLRRQEYGRITDSIDAGILNLDDVLKGEPSAAPVSLMPATIAYKVGNYDAAIVKAKDVLQAADSKTDLRLVADAHLLLGRSEYRKDHFEASRKHLQSSLEAARTLIEDAPDRCSAALCKLADCEYYAGDLGASWKYCDACLSEPLTRPVSASVVSAVTNIMGHIAWLRDDLKEARTLSQRALAIGQQDGMLRTEADALDIIGYCECASGDSSLAMSSFGRSLKLREVSRDHRGIAETCEILAMSLVDIHAYALAAQVLAVAASQRHRTQTSTPPCAAARIYAVRMEIEAALGPTHVAVERALGASLAMSELTQALARVHTEHATCDVHGLAHARS